MTIERSSGYWVARLPGELVESISLVADALRDHQILGAALAKRPLSVSDLWLAYEWRDSLVVEREIESEWLEEAGWIEDRGYRHPRVRVYRLADESPEPTTTRRHVEAVSQYRESLTSARPTVIDLDLSVDRSRDHELFGDLAYPWVGGAVALLMLSGATPAAGRVQLRNPAALELDHIDDERILSRQQQLNVINVRAIGLSASGDISQRLDAFANPEGVARAWSSRGGTQSFFVVMEVEALVDPELLIPVGQIFEQASVNDTQTLATASNTIVVVTPGRLRPLVLPAWCLNAHLKPPSGEPLNPTPLRVRHTESQSQSDIWHDRARIMAV
jgi:hypothetical protein